MIEQDIHAALTNELAAFRKHLSGLHISVLGFVLIVVLAGGWFVNGAMRRYDDRLAKADARYEVLQTDLKKAQEQYQADMKQVASQDKQVQVIDHVIKVDNTKADASIKEVTKPDRTQEQIAQDAEQYLAVKPTFSADKLFQFPAPAVQGFIATRIDRDRLSKVVDNQSVQLALERSTEDTLKQSLATSQTSLAESQASVADYRKLAHKGKFRKFMESAEKVALVVGGIALGKRI